MIYLDNHATTQTDPRVLEAMLPYFGASFGNASSSHVIGDRAGEALSEARARLADCIGADSREIIFTSGATEANNLAIKGAMRHLRLKGKDRIIIAETEHSCVRAAAFSLRDEGFAVDILPVGPDGLLDPAVLEQALTDSTGLVSVMLANNEIGTIQPLREIAALAHAAGALVHTDAAQAFGKVPLDVRALDVDFLSLSAHKAHGPMGIGALYVRHKPRARLLPLFDGGGQERGLRSGTVPVPLAAGLGKAAEIIAQDLTADMARASAQIARLRTAIDDLPVNGSQQNRVPQSLSISVPHLPRAEMLARLEGLIVSSGSACSSADAAPSHVLMAIGLPADVARSTFRLCVSRFTTDDEISQACAILKGLRAPAELAA